MIPPFALAATSELTDEQLSDYDWLVENGYIRPNLHSQLRAINQPYRGKQITIHKEGTYHVPTDADLILDDSITEWLQSQPTDGVYWEFGEGNTTHFWFASKNDATLFKLTWGGTR